MSECGLSIDQDQAIQVKPLVANARERQPKMTKNGWDSVVCDSSWEDVVII